MPRPAPINTVFLLLLITLLACSKSDEQREFENRATQNEPHNITETDANGNVGSEDRDDWQISPNYRGLISLGSPEVQPPYPNPVNLNTNLTVQLDLNYADALQRVEIYSFRYPGDIPMPVKTLEQSDLSLYNTITINSNNIAAGEGADASTVYRLLIYDGRETLITYGDIRIQ